MHRTARLERIRPPRTTVVAIAIALVALSIGPAVASAHETGASAQGHEATVPFLAAIGLSTLLSVAIGLGAVRGFRSKLASDPASGSDSDPADPDRDHEHGDGAATRIVTSVLLILLGLLALLSVVGQYAAVAIGGVLLGGAVAWAGRARGVSPHDGCADAAFGAIALHRSVEGVLVAGVYVASAALGLVGLAVLTVHAIGETVAIGGLYAPVGRGWAIGSVTGVNLGFLAGALVGRYLIDVVSPPIATVVLAGVGGVLLVTGIIELRASTHRRRRLNGPTPGPG
ncbi:hypothetical protein ACFO5R_16000 [Halosolutus amylolyticus]|uniref:Uncharacterized protein n=1 Tax=Halosolutus amylolyticus TaxID=2932267 RepID=A0ABD5PU13_9EURY|nr:hypothetical protein [Halosolutus amylolyticus]